jgi:hypothetical protein
MKHIKFYCFFFIVVLYVVSFSGCKKTESSNQPALPPAASMEMDGLASFASQKKSAPAICDSSNFLIAYDFVKTWKTTVDLLFVTPVAIYKEALKNNAVFKDSLWTWTYIVEAASNLEFKAILTGYIEGDTSVFWTMRVSSIGTITTDYNNFKWFEGRSGLKHNGGWWKFYDRSNKPKLMVEWENTGESSRWIKYTNVSDCEIDKGNYIKYGVTGDPVYNSYFSLYEWGDYPKIITIEWNKATYEGRITINQEGTSNQYLWDSSLKNK